MVITVIYPAITVIFSIIKVIAANHADILKKAAVPPQNPPIYCAGYLSYPTI